MYVLIKKLKVLLDSWWFLKMVKFICVCMCLIENGIVIVWMLFEDKYSDEKILSYKF